MTPAVEFDNVGFQFAAQPVLSEFSVRIAGAETLVLLGRSGSGKTTALRLVNRLLLPTSGTVKVRGISTAEVDPIALRRGIGYVIQETGLFPHFTIGENVGLVPRLEKWEAGRIRERVHELLDQVGLPPDQFAQRYPRELSGGQRQRVGIARALAAHASLLLLDEPFGALDPVTRLELQRQFLQLRDRTGMTSIFVTHDIQEALRLATRVAVLNQGRLEMLATPSEFRKNPTGEAARFLETLEPPAVH